MTFNKSRWKMGSLDFRIGCLDVLYWLLCLQFFSVGLVAPQTCELVNDPEVLTFDTLQNPNISMVKRDSDGMVPLYRMQKLFLNAVQPNPFPKGRMTKKLFYSMEKYTMHIWVF